MEKLREIMAEARFGVLATCVGGRARVRPMAFVLKGDGCLWSSTYRESGKVREMEENPVVEILFVDGKGNQARVEGLVDLGGGEAEKAALLEANPRVRNHFSSERDPRFVLLKVMPSRIRWKPPGFSEYTEISE
ncbi:MAG: pyridoxamine 5'-phosphate oxidase family protein [Polyangia bacterium]|jgi:general stress protein 26|nr:pyridoxamine 5'-phosphate oxidase family protein [Polyangia bacterium]